MVAKTFSASTRSFNVGLLHLEPIKTMLLGIMMAVLLLSIGCDKADNNTSAVIDVATVGDQDNTPRYKTAITLPDLSHDEQLLVANLRQVADVAKKQFIDTVNSASEFEELANRQLAMQLGFSVVAVTERFISVRETGYEDMGGAHPIPVEATFVYDRHQQQMVALEQLFNDSTNAINQLADYARDALQQQLIAQVANEGNIDDGVRAEIMQSIRFMLDSGTEPTTANFSLFVVNADSASNSDTAASPSITLVFPPYQVAAYVYGTQTVEVPAKVFYPYLAADYRAAFHNPTKAE